MAKSLRNIAAIAGKELRGYFGSPVAWVMMGLFAFIFGYFFTVYLDFFVRNGMQAQFGGGPQTQNVNMEHDPAAPEQRERADPVPAADGHDADVLGGEALGHDRAAAHVAAHRLRDHPRQVPRRDRALRRAARSSRWSTSASCSASATRSGSRSSSGYLGLLLLGSCFISIGLFISSTTKNQMVAGAATFVVALLFWIINWFADSAGPTASSILSYLSITQHFDDFGKGVIDTKHVIFYLSFISFGLFLTLKSVDSERWRG